MMRVRVLASVVASCAVLAACGSTQDAVSEAERTVTTSEQPAGADEGDAPEGGWASLLPAGDACAADDDASADPDQLRRSANCLVNEVRRRHGVDELDGSEELRAGARGKLADMLRCGEFSHQACGRGQQYWFEEAGYVEDCREWATGENLGIGERELGSPRQIVRGWLESPGHRRNLLADRWSDHDIAVERRDSWSGTVGDKSRSFSQVNVWVSHFGRRAHC